MEVNATGLASDSAIEGTAREWARISFDLRRRRSRHFSNDLFGEAAWDVLLCLFVNENTGKQLTPEALADAIEFPLSTMRRWIEVLEREYLIQHATRTAANNPSYVLTDKCRTELVNLFG